MTIEPHFWLHIRARDHRDEPESGRPDTLDTQPRQQRRQCRAQEGRNRLRGRQSGTKVEIVQRGIDEHKTALRVRRFEQGPRHLFQLGRP